ncbi:hypothetical protein HDU82_006542 [Entophlyctis luteolus]|nr:hypothetical protein HDU82_006542 [Entophlyctis luteolus]
MADQQPLKHRAKPGRKPASDEPPNKRIAQSREIQRAFRERRANYIRDLESKVQSLESKVAELTKAVEEKDSASEQEVRLKALEAENSVLRQLSSAVPLELASPADPVNLALLQNYTLPCFPDVSFGIPTDFSFGTINSMNPLFGSIAPLEGLPFNSVNLATDDLLTQLLASSVNSAPLTLVQSGSSSSSSNTDSPQTTTVASQALFAPAFTEYREPCMSFKDIRPECSNISLQQVVPGKSLADMTEEEKQEYICREVPALEETFEELEKIPSLAGQDELLDDLCRAIVMVSIKGGEEYKLSTECSIVAEVNPNTEFDATEHLLKVKERIYSVCTDEDAKQFSTVMHSGWEKHNQFVAERNAEFRNE